MNQVWLNGYMADEPKSGQSQTGVAYARFTVAIQQYGENKSALYLDCVTFRKTAEYVSKYLQKGAAVNVIGRITQKEWVDDQGIKRKRFEILANQVFTTAVKRNNFQKSEAVKSSAKEADEYTDDQDFFD